MKISRLKIENFRGIKAAELLFPDHVVLIGDNNTGKSTILDAIDLVLGPDRLSRRSPIDEHDFYVGRYVSLSGTGQPGEEPAEAAQAEVAVVAEVGQPGEAAMPDDGPDGVPAPVVQESVEPETVQIKIEASITGLSDEQKAHFREYIEWWNTKDGTFYTAPGVEGVDAEDIVEALRVTFFGEYVFDEDDFDGKTYFARSLEEGGTPQYFGRRASSFAVSST